MIGEQQEEEVAAPAVKNAVSPSRDESHEIETPATTDTKEQNAEKDSNDGRVKVKKPFAPICALLCLDVDLPHSVWIALVFTVLRRGVGFPNIF